MTYLLARSRSISRRSTSSCDNISHRVLNSSASAQSLHTLLSTRGPLPSFGVRPQPSPRPVLSFMTPSSALLSFNPSSPPALAACSIGNPPMTPHSIASFLCFMSSSCTACAIKGSASPARPRSRQSCRVNSSGVSPERRSHSIWSSR